MKLGTFNIPTEEVGDTFQLEGVVYGDGKQSVILAVPFAGNIQTPIIEYPTAIEWEEFLHQADDPVSPVGKAFVRKSTRQVDQAIAWACYARDGYACVYCDRTGVPLTYDHYLAQKFGGKTTMDNGRSSCRACNKAKGHMTITEWGEYAGAHGLHDGLAI